METDADGDKLPPGLSGAAPIHPNVLNQIMNNSCIKHMLETWSVRRPAKGGWYETMFKTLGWVEDPEKDKELWDPLVHLLKSMHRSGVLCPDLRHLNIGTVSVMWSGPYTSKFHIDQ